jgi:hypothetical protein
MCIICLRFPAGEVAHGRRRMWWKGLSLVLWRGA